MYRIFIFYPPQGFALSCFFIWKYEIRNVNFQINFIYIIRRNKHTKKRNVTTLTECKTKDPLALSYCRYIFPGLLRTQFFQRFFHTHTGFIKKRRFFCIKKSETTNETFLLRATESHSSDAAATFDSMDPASPLEFEWFFFQSHCDHSM